MLNKIGFKKIFRFLTLIILVNTVLLVTLNCTFAFAFNYPTTYLWGFDNNSSLNFDQVVDFSYIPHKGVFSENELVGYWTMNEGNGTIINDFSGNGSSGVVDGASWVDGKYGSALRFNGSGYVAVPFSSSFDVHDEITVEGWVNLGSGQSSSSPRFVDKDGSWLIHFSQSPPYSIVFNVYRGGQLNQTSTDAILSGNTWHNVACTFNSFTGQGKIYVDGVLKAVSTFPVGVPIDSHPSDVIIGDSKVHNRQINGTIDEFFICNKTKSGNDILALNSLDDITSFSNYYNFKDQITNNTLLIHVTSPIETNNLQSVVTCDKFFTENQLLFQANNSAILNIWTSKGPPIFISKGVWNNQNSTITLTLNETSNDEINWNNYKITTLTDIHSSVLPSNVTVGHGKSQTFNFNATQGYAIKVSIDGIPSEENNSYTITNVKEPHEISVVSSPLTYRISVLTDSGVTINPGNLTVNYDANHQFNMTAKNGYLLNNVKVDGVNKGNLTSYNLTRIRDDHTISVTSTPLNLNPPSPSPIPSPANLRNSPTPTINSTNQFPTTSPTTSHSEAKSGIQNIIETIAIIVLIIVGLGLAFKKGYITLENVNQEKA